MRVYDNFDLTDYNGYRIKSKCRLAFFPDTEQDIVDALAKNPDLTVIGSGHNIILSKDYYEQPFLIISDVLDQVELKGCTLAVGAGAFLPKISAYALKQELTGLEFCFDIPSSVGGAVVMNAGTKEGCIEDVVERVRFLDLKTRSIHELSKNELELEYRTSYFQKNKNTLILKVWFTLSKGNIPEIEQKMNETKSRRWKAQPREYPNCGSVFKRPPGMFVGPMLDELGLKGFAVGGAQVSEKHSGFIVNKGSATGKDILDLIKNIQQKVLERFEVNLEVEQRII